MEFSRDAGQSEFPDSEHHLSISVDSVPVY